MVSIRHVILLFAWLAACQWGGLCAIGAGPLSLELASTPQQKQWGLMGRRSLPADGGMLFLYEQPHYVNVWMFNCFIDLDVAFLDKEGRLLQIATLKAFPQAMDPQRPIRTLDDLDAYPADDAVRRFFLDRAVASRAPVYGFLEVNAGWLAAHGVVVGDRLVRQDDGRYAIVPLP